MIIAVNEIMELIPHRYPFLLIDKIIEIVPNTSAVAVKNVTINEGFFQGHFPGHPVMPGVLIVEALAQAAAVFMAHENKEMAQNKIVYFASIEKANFRKPVVPGDVLYLHVNLIKQRGGNLWKVSGEAQVSGVRVADAIFSAILVNKEQ